MLLEGNPAGSSDLHAGLVFTGWLVVHIDIVDRYRVGWD